MVGGAGGAGGGPRPLSEDELAFLSLQVRPAPPRGAAPCAPNPPGRPLPPSPHTPLGNPSQAGGPCPERPHRPALLAVRVRRRGPSRPSEAGRARLHDEGPRERLHVDRPHPGPRRPPCHPPASRLTGRERPPQAKLHSSHGLDRELERALALSPEAGEPRESSGGSASSSSGGGADGPPNGGGRRSASRSPLKLFIADSLASAAASEEVVCREWEGVQEARFERRKKEPALEYLRRILAVVDQELEEARAANGDSDFQTPAGKGPPPGGAAPAESGAPHLGGSARKLLRKARGCHRKERASTAVKIDKATEDQVRSEAMARFMNRKKRQDRSGSETTKKRLAAARRTSIMGTGIAARKDLGTATKAAADPSFRRKPENQKRYALGLQEVEDASGAPERMGKRGSIIDVAGGLGVGALRTPSPGSSSGPGSPRSAGSSGRRPGPPPKLGALGDVAMAVLQHQIRASPLPKERGWDLAGRSRNGTLDGGAGPAANGRPGGGGGGHSRSPSGSNLSRGSESASESGGRASRRASLSPKIDKEIEDQMRLEVISRFAGRMQMKAEAASEETKAGVKAARKGTVLGTGVVAKTDLSPGLAEEAPLREGRPAMSASS